MSAAVVITSAATVNATGSERTNSVKNSTQNFRGGDRKQEANGDSSEQHGGTFRIIIRTPLRPEHPAPFAIPISRVRRATE